MSDHPSLASQPPSDSLNASSPPRKWARKAWIHITRHVGVGIICSVAYFDPYVCLVSWPFFHSLSVAFASRGNWGVDLQAGSDFGYKLLFVVLLAGIFAVILQVTFFVSIFTLLGDTHHFVEGIGMQTWRGDRARSEGLLKHTFSSP